MVPWLDSTNEVDDPNLRAKPEEEEEQVMQQASYGFR